MRAGLLAGLAGGAFGLLVAAAAAAEPPQLAPPVLYPAGEGTTALAAADFDSNGTVDILVRDAVGTLTRHDGDGHGGLVRDVVFVSGPALADAAPLDGDTLPDLFEVASAGDVLAVRARIARRDGEFGQVLTSPGGVATEPLRDWVSTDADADGRVDVVVATGSAGLNARLWIAPGRGDGSFGRWREAGASPGTTGLRPLPDVNGDRRPELVMQDGGGNVWISLSQGAVGFAPPERRVVSPLGGEPGQLVVGRFGGDEPMLAVADQARRCIVLLPLDPGAPGGSDCFPVGGHVEGLAAADLDGDRATDLVAGLAAGELAVLYGRAGVLSAPELHPVPNTDFVSGPIAADLDADGKPDIVAVANLRSLAVFRNVGAPQAYVTPARLDFAGQAVDTTSRARRLFVINEGRWRLALNAATIGGPDAADFVIRRDGCAGILLPFGESCTVRIRFQPGDVGRRTASLVVSARETGPVREVQLTGFGTA